MVIRFGICTDVGLPFFHVGVFMTAVYSLHIFRIDQWKLYSSSTRKRMSSCCYGYVVSGVPSQLAALLSIYTDT